MRLTRTFLLCRDAFGCTLLTFLVGGLLYLLFDSVNFLNPFENAFRDFNYTDIYYSQLQDTVTKTDKIILVNVGNSNRLDIALGIEKVAAQKPKAIGLDIIFKDRKEKEFDSILSTTIKNTPNLVTAFRFDDEKIIENHASLGITIKNSGYLNLSIEDETSVVRKFIAAKQKDSHTFYSFPVKVAAKSGFLKKKSKEILNNQELTINYLGKQERYLSFDLKELIIRDTIPKMKNAIVLLGFLGNKIGDNLSLEDKHFSPLNPKFAGRSFPDMYGMVIHANILEMLSTDQFIYKTPNFINWLLAFLACWALIALGMKIGKKNAFIFDLGIKFVQVLATVILLYITYLLVKYNIHLQITPLIIFSLLGLEMICFYTHLTRFIKKLLPWKSYVLD